MAGIQEKQTTIMNAELRPVLRIPDWESKKDQIKFTIENVGNGIAENPEVLVHLLCYNSFGKKEYCPRCPVEKNQLVTVQDETPAILSPTDGNSQHTVGTEIYLSSCQNSSLDRAFSEVLSEISAEKDFDNLYYQIEIGYDHSMAELERGHLFLRPRRASLTGPKSFEELHQRSSNISTDFSRFTIDDGYPFRKEGTHYFERSER
ncbi:hypothetical protein [Haloarchaeobius sp. DFWS5]|uniref:hypothetical protein n=1 Tax=Haloarchaeobius sp. DFWS5 TaxID=3446114 RepID=UPI003EBA3C9D